MKSRLLAPMGLMLVMAAAMPASAEESLLNYVPASADSIIWVNEHKLANEAITSEVLSLPSMRPINLHFKKMTALTGIDPQKDLDSVCYARNMAAGEESGALLVQGRFDEKRLIGLLGLTDKTLETTTIAGNDKVNTWQDGAERKYQVFLPNGVAAMAFSSHGMEEILEAAKQPHKGGEPRYAKGLELLPSDYHDALAWLRLPTPANLPIGQGSAAGLHINSFVCMADADKQDLKLNAVAMLDSSEDAANVTNIVNGLASFMKLQSADAKTGNGSADDIKSLLAEHVSLDIGASSNTVRAKLSLPMHELISWIRKVNGEYARLDQRVDGQQKELMRQDAQFGRMQKEVDRRSEELAKMRSKLAEEESKLKARSMEERMKSETNGTSDSLPLPPAVPSVPTPPTPPTPPQE